MHDVVREHRILLLNKVELELKKHLEGLSQEEIQERCHCIVYGLTYTYYLDGKLILKADYCIKYRPF